MSQPSFRFEEFDLDIENCELRRSGHPVKLEQIPMRLLALLLQNSGRLVRRDTINEKLWGSNVFVETEHSINTAVNKLRAILRDDPRRPRFIKTVVGQGYCFIAKVEVLEPSEMTYGLAPASVSTSSTSIPVPLTAASSPEIQEDLTERPIAQSNLEAIEFSSPQVLPSDNQAGTDGSPTLKKLWILSAILIPLIALLVIAIVTHILRERGEPSQPVQAKSNFHSVAVLPFRNLAQNSAQDYLVDGLTDQLITDLAKSTSLRVISRRSVMQYKGVQKPLSEIAQALNADAIVEGSYLRAGQQIRITVQLLDARNDRLMWAQTYDESAKDLLAMQDQVTNDIAHQVAIFLGSNFISSRLSPVNVQARDAYLRGRYLWNERTLRDITASIGYYTEAIRIDPNYADAYAALSEAYVLLNTYGGDASSDSLWKAQFAAERAIQLDSSLGQAHIALAAVETDRDWDWKGSELEFRRAIQLDPDPTAHHWYSLHLSRLGRSQEAGVEIERALAIDPLSLIINTDAAETAYWARKPDDAVKRISSVLVLNPNFADAHLVKGKILEELHQYQQAESEFTLAGTLFGGGPNVEALRGHALALAGDRDQALKIAKGLEEKSARTYVSGVDIALIYCGLHQTDDAMKWLDRGYQKRDKGMNMLRVDPLFDGCRDDARFNDLLRKLKLTA
jgi:TolB-like protein/DNA-binding winged helix-turn-helix (wHTH) protein/Tfp pilus assembly protein PilF